jgi:hypothetical protein
MTDLLDPPVAERPQIDPRIARRWIDARREEGRRRLHILVALGATVVAATLAAGSLLTPLFHVRHVRVSVAGPISPAAVARLSGVGQSSLMIHVDAAAVASRLDADPWLGRARVARRWPATVTMSVEVRNPLVAVALSPAGAGYAEVDRTGRVLATLTSPQLGIPLLTGVGAVPAAGGWLAGTAGLAADPATGAAPLVDMTSASDGPDVPAGVAAALAVVAALPDQLRSDVVSVVAGSGPHLSLTVAPPRLAAGTVTVTLGDGSHLQAKITALETILAQSDLAGVTGLDLSVPTRPAAVAGAH